MYQKGAARAIGIVRAAPGICVKLPLTAAR
jgi:hypothetical protein